MKQNKNLKTVDCVFCKIAKNEIPSNKIYEDKNFFAFLDIRPVAHGHVLIIPKKHVVWMQEVDDKTIAEIFKLTKKIMLALIKGLKCDYVVEYVAGNEVAHFHIHLIPRYLNDNLPEFSRVKYPDGHENKIIKKIILKL